MYPWYLFDMYLVLDVIMYPCYLSPALMFCLKIMSYYGTLNLGKSSEKLGQPLEYIQSRSEISLWLHRDIKLVTSRPIVKVWSHWSNAIATPRTSEVLNCSICYSYWAKKKKRIFVYATCELNLEYYSHSAETTHISWNMFTSNFWSEVAFTWFHTKKISLTFGFVYTVLPCESSISLITLPSSRFVSLSGRNIESFYFPF